MPELPRKVSALSDLHIPTGSRRYIMRSSWLQRVNITATRLAGLVEEQLARHSDRDRETIILSREGGNWLAFYEHLSMSPRLSILRMHKGIASGPPFTSVFWAAAVVPGTEPPVSCRSASLRSGCCCLTVAPFAAAILKQINAISRRRWPSGKEDHR